MNLDTILCADALTFLASLPSASVDAVITDPPYGASRPSGHNRRGSFLEIAGNDKVDGFWLDDAFRLLKDDGAMYCFTHWSVVDQWNAELKTHRFRVRNLIVWDKMVHGAGDLQTCYAPQYELIPFAVKGRHELRGRRPVDIIRFPKVPPNALVHPYQKPVGLLEKLIITSTDNNAIVIDPFVGSGTTAIAARQCGRHFIGCDSSPEYVELANKRLAKPWQPLLLDA